MNEPRWELNPEYEELAHYPSVGCINGIECFDSTKPRLTDEQYEKQRAWLEKQRASYRNPYEKINIGV